MDKLKIKRALISVYNKTGLTELAKTLTEDGVEIISSGGTAKALRDAGIIVSEVSEYTGSPEIFGGRVKTMHPRICGGILMRRNRPDDVAEASESKISPIDLIVVNLYPFAEKAAAGISEADALEEIDIGGVTLLRAAAKNYPDVAVLCSPGQYGDFIKHFKSDGGITLDLRRRWAGEAFTHTAFYDSAIESYFTGEKPDFHLEGKLYKALRYGENPHQKASWYKTADRGISACRQLWGKELSYINIADLDAALNITLDFDEPACVIIKHITPGGLAVGDSPLEAYRRAFSCDTRSPFGGIVGFNREVEQKTAEEMSKIFLEAIIAPRFSDEALKILKKKKNLRLMECGDNHELSGERRIVSVSGGFLVQECDDIPIVREDFKVVTKLNPTEEQWIALVFGAKAVKWAKSNAVVLCNQNQTLGIGCGQTSRVGAVEIAVANAERFGHSLEGSVMASDAFFPFSDSVEEAAKVGVKVVVQPGGSVKDGEVIKKADELGIAMVFTGKRHFRH